MRYKWRCPGVRTRARSEAQPRQPGRVHKHSRRPLRRRYSEALWDIMGKRQVQPARYTTESAGVQRAHSRALFLCIYTNPSYFWTRAIFPKAEVQVNPASFSSAPALCFKKATQDICVGINENWGFQNTNLPCIMCIYHNILLNSQSRITPVFYFAIINKFLFSSSFLSFSSSSESPLKMYN